jgi:hypothetical protein
MKRSLFTALFILVTVSLSVGQAGSQSGSSAAASSQSNSDSEIRGAFGTTLTKPLDSKKLKEGDIVICQTAGVLRARSGLMIPSGSKVIGHVTEAKARSKGDSESSLAIVFDKIEISKGREIPMKGVLQAVGPSLGDNSPTTGAAGGLSMGGRGGDTANVPPPSSGVTGANSGIHPVDNGTHPLLNPQSTGVLGIHGLEMSKDNVLTSSGKEVKLDSGTQMMIRGGIPIPVE